MLIHLHVRNKFFFLSVLEFKSFVYEKYVMMCTIVFIASVFIYVAIVMADTLLHSRET